MGVHSATPERDMREGVLTTRRRRASCSCRSTEARALCTILRDQVGRDLQGGHTASARSAASKASTCAASDLALSVAGRCRAGHRPAGRPTLVGSPSRKVLDLNASVGTTDELEKAAELRVVGEPDDRRAHGRSQDHRVHATAQEGRQLAAAAPCRGPGRRAGAGPPGGRHAGEHARQTRRRPRATPYSWAGTRGTRRPSATSRRGRARPGQEASALGPCLRIGQRRAGGRSCAARCAARGGNQRRSATPISGRPSSGTPAARKAPGQPAGCRPQADRRVGQDRTAWRDRGWATRAAVASRTVILRISANASRARPGLWPRTAGRRPAHSRPPAAEQPNQARSWPPNRAS